MKARVLLGASIVAVMAASVAAQPGRVRPVTPVLPPAVVQPIVVEGEALLGSANASEGPLSVQAMAPFGAAWSGGAQLYWVPARVGARLALTVNVPAAGTYSIAGSFTRAPDYGDFEVLANDAKVGAAFSGYAARVAHSGQVVLGRGRLNAGANLLVLQITGKDRQSTGYMVGVDRLELTPQAATLAPAIKADDGPGPVPLPTAPVSTTMPDVQRVGRPVLARPFRDVPIEPITFKPVKFTPADTPNADLRPTILKKQMAVRDQGNRGTCSVHAMTFLLEYMYATRKNLNFRDLSEEYLNYVTNLVTGKNADGDFFNNLDLGYQKWGTYPEGLVPYKPVFDPKYKVPQAYMDVAKKWVRFQADFIKAWDPDTGATMGDLYKVMIQLEKDTPVAVGMWWPTKGNFKTVQVKGLDVIVVPKQRNVDCADGHSVAIVGYRKDPAFAGGGYFIFRNSGGPGWGDQGYGYIPFDYLLKYANDLVYYHE